MISKKNRTSTQISPAMKKLLASLFFVFATLFTYGQQFHVASYNIRYANPADEQRGNGWSQRCPVICNQIAYESFDLVGMQEVLKSQFDDLSNRLSRDYGCIGVGRNDGKTSGEYAPIFYKKDRFILLDSGCFWLSETPDKPSVGWDAKYPRICSWAQLQDRNTGNTLYFLNTHFEVDRVPVNIHFYRVKVIKHITAVVVVVTNSIFISTQTFIHKFLVVYISSLHAELFIQHISREDGITYPCNISQIIFVTFFDAHIYIYGTVIIRSHAVYYDLGITITQLVILINNKLFVFFVFLFNEFL